MIQALNYKLRAATPEDVPALRENWRLSFGDTDDYLNFFFSRRFDPDNTFVAELQGAVVSQLFLLPADVHTQDGILHAYYLFAAATHPEYRGQGIMGSLIKRTESLCMLRGADAIVLLPGSPELYGYYEKFGFRTAFYRRRISVTRAELASLSEPVTPNGDAGSVIERILYARDGLLWDKDAVCYALDEHRLFRGSYAAGEHAFVSVCDEEATCLCMPQHFGECASLLLSLSDRTEFSLILPPDMPFGTPEDGGMICRFRKKSAKLRDAFICFAME